LIMNNNKIIENNQTDNRADKLKLYSIGSVVLLIAIIILVNFLFDKVLGKALTFDFSDSAQNTISQVSVDYLDSLPEGTHIRVVGLFNRPEKVASSRYQYIIPLLDDYVKKSDGKVTVEYINPTEHPSVISELDPNNSYDLASCTDSFVVEYNGKIKVISAIDCYSYDENYYLSTGSYLITGNNTEFTFSNTMYVLTNGYTCKAYIITGLKEDGNVSISKIIEGMSVEVGEIRASDSFAIPEDCDLLIINGPNTDITEKMYVAMTDYLSRGGKMFIAVDFAAHNVQEKFERLNKLVNQMNINIDPVLVYENDPSYQLNGYQIDSIVTADVAFTDYASTSVLHSTYARSVRKIDNPNSGAQVSSVLLTSESAATTELDAQGMAVESSVSTLGQYNVALFAANQGTDPAKMFVFGTTNFSSDAYIQQYSLNDPNVEFFKSCIRNLLSTKISASLEIYSKSIESYSIDTAKATTSSSTLMLVIFMIFIPVVLVAMAVIVYAKRKNL